MRKIILLLSLTLLAVPASSKQLVRTFSGTSDTTTATFQVEAPWIIDWRLDGDYDAMVALDVTLVEARSGRHVGRVLHTKRRGYGIKLFNQGGRYQLRVSGTLARWTLKIEQLTEEEAELYKPRNP
ncbi:MAG: hypothetical protein OEV03_01550 [Gammaproteobacteria bacterium]|nr:hypothetical protein [Gammaproteobacteria bacterium]